MDASWGSFLAAGAAGFGLGLGLVTGAAVVKWLRGMAARE